MSHKRKSNKNAKAVLKLTGVEATLLAMPHYNGFACGHGAHGDVKFNRAKEKARFVRALERGE